MSGPGGDWLDLGTTDSELIGRALCFRNNPGIKMTSSDILYLLPTSQFHVFHNFGCGRELVATKDFQPGDLILYETPLLVFGDRKALVKRLGQLEPAERDELFDMQGLSHPSEAGLEACRAVMERLWTEAEVYYRLFYGEDNQGHLLSGGVPVRVEDIFSALSIAHLNAHSFHPSDQEPDRAAIFPVSAKIAHSCLPNSSYTVTESGLEYYAVSHISVGESITASYLDSDVLISSTEKRRARLARSKDFFCLCVKCRRPDYASGLPCRSNGCVGVSICAATGGPARWRCTVCGSRLEPAVKTLRSVEREYNALQDCDDVDEFVDQLTCLIDAARPDLSRTHHLLLEMSLELSTVHLAVAHAVGLGDGEEGARLVNEHRRSAVSILQNVVSNIECVHDECKCLHSDCCQLSHPPTATAAYIVYRALCSVVRMKSEVIPRWITRYRSLLETLYGRENTNVATMRQLE